MIPGRAGRVILVGDDNPHDVTLFRLAFRRAGCPDLIQSAENGAGVKRYLLGEGEFADRARAPYPDLILLDMKMPHACGFDVLRWLGQQETLRKVPVIIMTGIENDLELRQARSLGAAAFLIKPGRFEELVRLAWEIHEFADGTEVTASAKPSPAHATEIPRLRAA